MHKKRIKASQVLSIILFFQVLIPLIASEVEADGSYSYSIPLNLPPATGGMGLEMSLTYNSGSGNGLVGMGWDLTGYDCISRDFWYPVRVIDPPDANADHFLFMGQKLIKDEITGYYHTEQETYLRIEFCHKTGAINGNGNYWTVTDKNGVTKYYGYRYSIPNEIGQTDPVGGGGYIFSHSAASNDPARIWLLDMVKDVFGNYYTIDYVQNPQPIGSSPDTGTTCGWYPKRIIYTKNDKYDCVYGKYRMVEFVYSFDREDVLTSSRPTPVSHKALLTSINVYTDVTIDSYDTVLEKLLHHSYQLSYRCDLDTGSRNFLMSFRELGSDGVLSRPALQFTYTPGLEVVVNKCGLISGQFDFNKNDVYHKVKVLTNADFDGDGIDDVMVYKGNHALRIYFTRDTELNGGFPQNESKLFNVQDWQDEAFPEKAEKSLLFGDFNGDARILPLIIPMPIKTPGVYY